MLSNKLLDCLRRKSI